MCGCEHHWDENAACTCLCPSHRGVREEMAAATATATPARLSDEERDLLAESLRHQWEGGRHRFMTWGDLSERDKDRWREEVEILPFAAILAARAVQPTPPVQAEAVGPSCTDPACPIYARHRTKGQTFPLHGPHDFRAALAHVEENGETDGE